MNKKYTKIISVASDRKPTGIDDDLTKHLVDGKKDVFLKNIMRLKIESIKAIVETKTTD